MKVADLKPGMLIKGVGLIAEVDATSDDTFWHAPNIHFIDFEDSYCGTMGRTVKEGEAFQVLYHPADTGYKNELNKMLLACNERLDDVIKDLDIIKGYLPK